MPLSFSHQRYWKILLGLMIFLIAVILLGLVLGSSPLDWKLAFHDPQSADRNILIYSRLPRVLLAAIVGLALSSSGVAFQSLLRNPLADPYLLGVSGGAALGGVLGVTLNLHFGFVTALAFASALLSLFLVYSLAQTRGRLPVSALLLTGMVFNSFCFALIVLINTVVPSEKSHRIWYLMVGSLETESYSNIAFVAAFVLLGFFSLWRNSAAMNLMSTGDESAEYLGLDVHRFRKSVFFAGSLMVGATVSVSGLIGLVGLFIPHVVRLVLGADHRLLLPASGLFGAAFLILADLLARTLLSQATYQTQFPVGVITALLGGPFFVYLVRRKA